MSDSSYLTIGKVVKSLQDRFPDLSVSKVRYLEDEGLITPSSRTSGGYRLYSSQDVHRLEKILHLQKTKFLPLSVIKEQLDSPETSQHNHEICFDDFDEETLSKYHTLERIPELLGVSISFVRQLAEIGMIKFDVSPQGREVVSGKDFPVIKSCDALRRFGMEPKNLRQYVIAANRETALFEQALVPYGRRGQEMDEEQQKQFDHAFDQMLLLVNAIRVDLIKKRLQADFEGKN